MAVVFSEVPADFGSVFGEQMYGVSGLNEGQTAIAELFTAGGDSPVGAKLLRGGDTEQINVSAYLRRCLAPQPAAAGRTGLFAEQGRSVMVAVRCGDTLSAARTFTGAVRRLALYELLTVLPVERTIAWEERDEVSLSVPDCSMTYGWTVEGGGGHAFQSEAQTVQCGIVTLAVVMGDLKQRLEEAGVETASVSAVTVTAHVAGNEVARIRYRIVERPAGSVRFCWFNTVGGCDCHTFAPSTGERIAVSKETYVGKEGNDAMVTGCTRRQTFSSGYLPAGWLEGIAEMAAAPLVWRFDGETAVPVVVDGMTMEWRQTENPDAVTFTVQDKAVRVCQCF